MCFEGVECIDVAAPGVGAECGPCPQGYMGDGEKCAGVCVGGCIGLSLYVYMYLCMCTSGRWNYELCIIYPRQFSCYDIISL